MTGETVFSGFSDATFDFLRDLTEHNNRDWFTANRERYESCYLQPAVAFIADLGPRLAAGLPGDVHFEPRLNGSLLRINRDIRFSHDKTPYKNHLDMWFWTGEKRGWETPGYFMRLLPDSWAMGAGIHHLSREGLGVYRRAVVDPRRGKELEEALARIPPEFEIGRQERKTVPRGFDAGHPRARFLLYEGLVAMIEGPVPAEAASDAFVDYCLARFQAASPVAVWLASIL